VRRPRAPRAWKEFEKVSFYKKSEVFVNQIKLQGDVKVALIYPNDYRVASANLSFHDLFERFNALGNVRCERFFYDRSFEKFYSIDSRTPLDEFRIWAISIHFELDILNVLELLRRFKVPLFSEERLGHHPVIVIGGALTYFNTALLELIADVVHIGDLSESFLSALGSLKSYIDRKEIIAALSGQKGRTCDSCFEERLASGVFITPHSVFGDRFLIEIGRSCFRKCRFCVVGYCFGPARFRGLDEVMKLMETASHLTNKFGLIAATVTDYPYLEELLNFIEKRDYQVSVSSLRLDALNEKLLTILRKSGQEQFTIAPEGGSQRLRNLYGKGISGEQILSALKLGRMVGFRHVKLYYIYGAVFESEEDRREIVETAKLCRELGYSKVTLSLNPLIPKPGTPLGTLPMQDRRILRGLERNLALALSSVGAKADFESIKESVIQFSLANMDRNGGREFLLWINNNKKGREFLYKYAERINLQRKE